mgnify:CR=1 FL=1
MLPVPKLAVYWVPARAGVLRRRGDRPDSARRCDQLTPEQLGYLINADLFTCGIASIIQEQSASGRLACVCPARASPFAPPCRRSISIRAVTKAAAVLRRPSSGAVIIAGIVTFVVAPFFANLIRLFPPVVDRHRHHDHRGRACVSWLRWTPVVEAPASSPSRRHSVRCATSRWRASRWSLILALYRFFKGFVATIAVLIGAIVVGTIVRAIFGFADFSQGCGCALVRRDHAVPLRVPTFNAAAIIAMSVVIMLITMVETTGDVFACADIVDEPVDKSDVARALRADGLSTTLGGILNSFPCTPASPRTWDWSG